VNTRSEGVVSRLADVLKKWDGVDTVAVVRSGDDPYDPYFFVSLDVYCSGPIPEAEARSGEFQPLQLFESSRVTRKDRFLVDEVPVRIEYKQTGRFDELISAAADGTPLFRDAGTYAFHRLQNAEVLFSRTDWVSRMRDALASLPDTFWSRLRRTQQAQAEHVYSDLSAAAAREDSLFFAVSAGRVVTSICALLFTVNRRFEPSSRHLAEEVARLKVVPDSFPANLDNFVRQENMLSMSQRRELAELMVRRVLSLSL